MQVDSLVTALERIEHAARDFLGPADKQVAAGALHNVLKEWGTALHQAHGLDPGLDDVRGLASRHCAAVQLNLETIQKGEGTEDRPSALVEQVRQLHMTVAALLPPLVRIADRE